MTLQGGVPVIAVRGDVPEQMVAYARTKLESVVAGTPVPVLGCEAHLDHHADPARRPSYHVDMAIDVNGDVVRARQSAETLSEAIDLAAARLDRRLAKQRDRRRSLRFRHRDETSWHHDDPPTDRPPYFVRPVEERTVVRRPTFAAAPESIEEAIDDLESLGDEFLLFVHDATNAEAVVYHVDGGYGLMQRTPTPDAIPELAPPLALGPAPAPADLDDALHTLDESAAPFENFVDPATDRGMVAYHRRDGHYGLAFAE
jgi:ribosomal subunit interface protein